MAHYYSSASSLEPDSHSEGSSDVDSAYGDSGSLRTTSINSSAYDYKFHHGRRYHAYGEGQYLLPNDDREQDRLDLQHHLFRLTLDGALNLAPISDSVQSALDVGCGTGIWAIEFADEHPDVQVLGIDLSPIQPGEVPPNCSFRVDDIEKDWLAHERFDYIHSRAMIGGITNWPKFFRTSFEHLRPGGYLELQDPSFPARCDDPELDAQSQFVFWHKQGAVAAARAGLDLTAPLKWAEQLRDAGFVDVHVKIYNWPIGPWAKGAKNKALGIWAQADFHEAAATPVRLFTAMLGWQPEEYEILVAKVRSEMKSRKFPVYLPVCFAYARRPLETQETTVELPTNAPPDIQDGQP